MSGDDLRILSDDGGMTVVSVTELVRNGDDLAGRTIDAIEDEFADDDDIVIER